MTERGSMTPERWTALLHGRLDGTLSTRDIAELELEIARNPAAAAELRAFLLLADVSLGACPEPPPGFASRVMSVVSRPMLEEPSGNALERFARSLFPGFHAWRPALGGALVMAVIALLLATFVARPVQDAVTPEAPSLVVHDFKLTAPGANKVCLVGSFNEWTVCEAPLVHDPETDTWSLRIELPRGRHEYMFVVDDGNWITDPGADIKVDDGFGNENAVVFI